MKYANGKINKALVIGVILYCVAFLDIAVNTIIAHLSNNGTSVITNAIMIGPFVFNPISVSAALAVGSIFVVVGIIMKFIHRRR